MCIRDRYIDTASEFIHKLKNLKSLEMLPEYDLRLEREGLYIECVSHDDSNEFRAWAAAEYFSEDDYQKLSKFLAITLEKKKDYRELSILLYMLSGLTVKAYSKQLRKVYNTGADCRAINLILLSLFTGIAINIFYLNSEINTAVSYTHLRAHETSLHLVCRLLLEKKKTKIKIQKTKRRKHMQINKGRTSQHSIDE
eukprot:TRINITY_DN65830_c0_g1_i3.p1 TRINITY_DN65830_c0_g1~~TRINITY_DN65830_c0_g1_i3.p1  ORF type:complete len:197 (-),score=40.41 TRINITY_DN65830_c0_g1_i3:35-625(-)